MAQQSKSPNQTLLVMVDGLDGVGKTTQVELIKNKLESAGQSVKASRINGGTPIGEDLRAVMLNSHSRPGLSDLYIAGAMYAALAEQINSWRQDKTYDLILVDRSPLSLVAYQAYGEGVDLKLTEQLLTSSMAAFDPDLIIVYDLERSVALKRNSGKLNNQDYFTSHNSAFFDSVRRGYQYAAGKYPVVAKIVDIKDLSPEDIQARSLEMIAAVKSSI